MLNNIQIIEKPESVSWNDIHEVLWQAHAKNRENGIFMRYPSLPGEMIQERVEGKGKMFVALDKDKVVGVAAVITKKTALWCGKGEYAYCCFSAVLPEYGGKGIYKEFVHHQEAWAISMDLNRIMFDSHENNHRVLEVNRRNGYKPVDYSVWKDHYNVVMVKWLDGCPYSNLYCKLQFLIHKWYRILRYKPGNIKRFGI